MQVLENYNMLFQILLRIEFKLNKSNFKNLYDVLKY